MTEFNGLSSVAYGMGYYILSRRYRIAGYLHGVLIFAFFARQNNLVKINSYKKHKYIEPHATNVFCEVYNVTNDASVKITSSC